MLQNTKKVFKIQLKRSVTPISVEEAQISRSGANCGDDLPNTAYVATQVSGTITSGDIVYSNPEATTLFIGGGLKYLISLDGGINVHSVAISNVGVITYIELCEEVPPRVLAQLSTGFPAAEDVTCATPTSTTNVYIQLSNPIQALNGDTLFTTEFGATVFDGASLFYAMNIPSLIGANQKTNIQVIAGVINVVDLCL